MNDFNDQTWVAFSDLSGLKAMYARDQDHAAKALGKFYNTVYELQQTDKPINSIVVSDNAIFWVDIQNSNDKLGLLLERIKELHKQLLPKYLLRTTIAYGHFKYEQRLEMSRIRKDMIIGGAYMDAYASNDKIDHGAIVIVKLPDGTALGRLKVSSDYKNMIKKYQREKSFYEYFWTVESSGQIEDFTHRREKANNATFSKLKELYSIVWRTKI